MRQEMKNDDSDVDDNGDVEQNEFRSRTVHVQSWINTWVEKSSNWFLEEGYVFNKDFP